MSAPVGEWGVSTGEEVVANDRGTPDLIAAVASNGKVGYVYLRRDSPKGARVPREAMPRAERTLSRTHLPLILPAPWASVFLGG